MIEPKCYAKPDRRRMIGAVAALCFVAPLLSPGDSRGELEYRPTGETVPFKIIVDDPRAKQLYLGFGLGIFGYNTYLVGGWGMDLNYISPYRFSFSALGYAAVRTSSDATDRTIRPFYEGTLRLHLSDEVNPVELNVTTEWNFWSKSGKAVTTPAHERETVSLRAGALSWGEVRPTIFAGLSFTEAIYLLAQYPSLGVERVQKKFQEIYIDAMFFTGEPVRGSLDRVGGRIGASSHAGRTIQFCWGGDIGYLRHNLIGRLYFGLGF